MILSPVQEMIMKEVAVKYGITFTPCIAEIHNQVLNIEVSCPSQILPFMLYIAPFVSSVMNTYIIPVALFKLEGEYRFLTELFYAIGAIKPSRWDYYEVWGTFWFFFMLDSYEITPAVKDQMDEYSRKRLAGEDTGDLPKPYYLFWVNKWSMIYYLIRFLWLWS